MRMKIDFICSSRKRDAVPHRCYNYGRGGGVGRGEDGVGTGVMWGGGVGRGTGVPEVVRGVGVGRGDPKGSMQYGLQSKPSLYWVRVLT